MDTRTPALQGKPQDIAKNLGRLAIDTGLELEQVTASAPPNIRPILERAVQNFATLASYTLVADQVAPDVQENIGRELLNTTAKLPGFGSDQLAKGNPCQAVGDMFGVHSGSHQSSTY
jgi:hypothetical protein